MYLGRQVIAFRGAGDEAAYSLFTSSNHGNFLELVKAQALFDPRLAAHLDRVVEDSRKRREKNPNSRRRGSLTTFFSKSTRNCLLRIISTMIQEYICEEILANGGEFSMMADGTPDVSVKEQMSIVVRFVDEYGPLERLLDIVETPDTTAEALFEKVVDVFKNLSIELKNLLCHTFDGASNMDGLEAGLHERLKILVPKSISVHCYSHVLQLVLESCCKCVPEAVSFFDLLRDSATFLAKSYKRTDLWKNILNFLFLNKRLKSLVKMSKTRWWAKSKGVNRIFTTVDSLLPAIIIVMYLISKDTKSTGEARSKAKGILSSWCSFETLAVGMLFKKIFNCTESVSQYLQDKQLDFVQASRLISTLVPDVATISVEKVSEEAESLAKSCNDILENINSSDEFLEKYGEIDAEVSAQPPQRRIPVPPRRPGELAGDTLKLFIFGSFTCY